MLSLLLTLFFSFFLIGLFTFGGGYAMIPMIQETVIEKGWVESIDEIFKFIGIAEATPGPFAVNISTFIGFNEAGFFGALFATLGVVMPSFIIILIIAIFGDRFLKTPIMQDALRGIRPIVIGLIASVALSILYKNLFNCELNIFNIQIKEFDFICLIITIIAFSLSFVKYKVKKNDKIVTKKISPILLIIISGLIGMILYSFI